MTSQPIVLCIIDGWGHSDHNDNNAIALAKTPHWHQLLDESRHTYLDASGLNVGLPQGQMGNSEVGHTCIGSGRVIFQDLPRINQAIDQQLIPTLNKYQRFIESMKNSGGTCHIMGLLSPGGVHAHMNHIVALAQLLNAQSVPTLIHGFLDGRDTAPCDGAEFVETFMNDIKDLTHVRLASLCGRFHAMDRDQRWDRIECAYQLLVHGQGESINSNSANGFIDHLKAQYQFDITDEFVTPCRADFFQGMQDGDGLIMANFRADRARQLLRALIMPEFTGFNRDKIVKFQALLGMSEYADDIAAVMPALFPTLSIYNSLGEIIANKGLKQLRIAETEKYAHVTFFFNGGREQPFVGEERCLIPSPKVKTYDLMPEMSAYAITDKLVEAIHSNQYQLIVVNYANPDMVGHTGNLAAGIKAVEVVDECLGKIVAAARYGQAALVVTADHGNIETMVDEATHQMHTAHTLNVVPFVLFNAKQTTVQLTDHGTLADIAPTLLQLMNMVIPLEMTGHSLIKSF